MAQNLVEINKIKINTAEHFNRDLVERLAESIETIGLLNPVVITPDFELVAGRHRLEAYKTIEHTTIPASIVTLGELEQRIAAIDENLIRKVLTRLEEAEQLSERKKIYGTLYPQTRRGVAGALAKHHGGAADKMSFAADVAITTGESERNVNRKIAVYERLHPEVRDLVRNSVIADSFSEIRRLCDYDFDTQVKIAELIRAKKAKTVGAANRLLDALFLFATTEKGKFQKSVKLAEKALKQLIDDGIVKDWVEQLTEETFLLLQEETLADLESLKSLQERMQVAIRIFEDGIRQLQTNTLVVLGREQELALAE